ncbi:MAG: hypothetical protein ACK4QL_09670 [Pseudanabaenaceae cyanobacterium]
MAREPRKPDEYIVHIMLEGGHKIQTRFATIEEATGWYANRFERKSGDEDMMEIPLRNLGGKNEMILLRPKRVIAIHIEPVFASSVEMFA